MAAQPISALRPRRHRRKPEETGLYRAVAQHLETFLQRYAADPDGRRLPRFVIRELRGYLECGQLCKGFVRVRCKACGQSDLVAFACKGRGFCPSCCGRRMAESAAHLVDHVLPDVPIRQWVLSLPHAIRFLLGFDKVLCREVRGIFIRAVLSLLKRRARARGIEAPETGAVGVIQRFDSALRLSPHYHVLVLDGVYSGFGIGEKVEFHAEESWTDADITWLNRHVRVLILGHLQRRGHLDHAHRLIADTLDPDDPLLACAAGAVQGTIAFGVQQGEQVERFGTPRDTRPEHGVKKKLCADLGGFSLHAGVRLPAGQRERCERLCRYVCRPPLATERVRLTRDGKIACSFRKPWKNGTEGVRLDPMTLMSRLAALIPPPRAHQLTYHGILAPAASHRDLVVPEPPEEDVDENAGSNACDHELAQRQLPEHERPSLRKKRGGTRRSYYKWSDLMRRVLERRTNCTLRPRSARSLLHHASVSSAA